MEQARKGAGGEGRDQRVGEGPEHQQRDQRCRGEPEVRSGPRDDRRGGEAEYPGDDRADRQPEREPDQEAQDEAPALTGHQRPALGEHRSGRPLAEQDEVQRQRPADQRPSENEGEQQQDRPDHQGGGHECARPLGQIVVDVELGEIVPGDQQPEQKERRRDQQHPGQQPRREAEERRCTHHDAPEAGPKPRQRAFLARMDHGGHHGDVQHRAEDDDARHHNRAGEPDRREQQLGNVLVGQRGLVRQADAEAQDRGGDRHDDRRQKQPVGQVRRDQRPAEAPCLPPAITHRAEIAHAPLPATGPAAAGSHPEPAGRGCLLRFLARAQRGKGEIDDDLLAPAVGAGQRFLAAEGVDEIDAVQRHGCTAEALRLLAGKGAFEHLAVDVEASGDLLAGLDAFRFSTKIAR